MTLTWTKEKPTVAGGYWVRSERLSPQPMLVEVILGVGLIVGPYRKPLDECDRWEFAGPIPLPTERSQGDKPPGDW